MSIIAAASMTVRFAEAYQASSYRIRRDNRDATPAVTLADLSAWPDQVGQPALGMGTFGGGLFGYGDNGSGFGDGGFGLGVLGVGSIRREHVTPALADGRWLLAVAAADAVGNYSAELAAAATVAGTPRPPANLKPSAYAGGALTLTFTTSPDDEG
jgi:hypothetical protein